jgi:alkaline phosphatase
MTNVDTTDANFHQEATVPLAGFETHAGEDVAIYTRGPGAYLFQGVLNRMLFSTLCIKKWLVDSVIKGIIFNTLSISFLQ